MFSLQSLFIFRLDTVQIWQSVREVQLKLTKIEQCYVDSCMRYWQESKDYHGSQHMKDTLKLWQGLSKQGNNMWRAYREVCDRISQEGK